MTRFSSEGGRRLLEPPSLGDLVFDHAHYAKLDACEPGSHRCHTRPQTSCGHRRGNRSFTRCTISVPSYNGYRQHPRIRCVQKSKKPANRPLCVVRGRLAGLVFYWVPTRSHSELAIPGVAKMMSRNAGLIFSFSPPLDAFQLFTLVPSGTVPLSGMMRSIE